MDAADGVLLTGGDDFHAEPLGLGATHPEAVPTPIEKQTFDLEVTRQTLERKMPVLGICYGMQCLGLSAGATLLQHLPEDRPGGQEHRDSALHPVQLEAGSKLQGAMGVAPSHEMPTVVSRHHQALDVVKAPWEVVARDAEGIVEAIEHGTLPFAIGVQWHPELSGYDSPHGRLIDSFVQAAAAH